jgi:RNA polymerase sigma-70 factor, ECF subfamily
MTATRASTASRSPLRLVSGEAAGGATTERTPVDLGDFDQVFRRYAPYVARVAARLLGRDGEVDDLVQDVFLEAHRGLGSVREPGAIGGWLARICVRRATRRLRRRRLLSWLSLESVREGDLPLLGGVSAEQRAEAARLYRALDRLPAEQRVAWLLRHIEGETLTAMVELCGCSQSTVQRRLRLAESQLAREVAP